MLFYQSFANPWLLLLLPLVLLLFLWLERRRHTTRFRWSDLSSLPSKPTLRARLNTWLPQVLRYLAAMALVFALARPQSLLEEDNVTTEGIDIVLAMDLSTSMLSEDFTPNRLEVSKRIAADFVAGRVHDRIGLVAFGGESFTKCPITTDRRIVQTFIETLQCGTLTDGTAIGMGLASAVKGLADSETPSKVVILITDGDNNTGYIQPLTAAEMAKTFGIKVYTIGVGSEGKVRTPYGRYRDGSLAYRYEFLSFDESVLKTIAETTGGRYFRATDENSLKRIYEEVDKLETTEVEVLTVRRRKDEFFWFVVLALVLLALEFLLKSTVFRTVF